MSSLDQYVAEFDARQRNARGQEPERVARLRQDAFERFHSVGFPTTRDEEWRFTSVAPIAGEVFTPGRLPSTGTIRQQVDAFRFRGDVAAELVFVNGHYVADLSREDRIAHGGMRRAESGERIGLVASFDRHPFVALNTAFFADVACVHVPAHAIVDKPIHVLFISTGGNGRASMSHPRVLLVLGDNSQASIVESHAGPERARYFTNSVTEIALGENALLDHYKLQHESVEAYHVGAIHVQAQRSANFSSHSLSLGGALVRNDVLAVLDGEGVECTLNGLYLADGQRLVDNHTTIDHAKPHCDSREIYKGILADRARGVFNGKIIVRPDAQKTDAKQTNRALLLSEDAQINTKPQLEIFANDVKCTHGAAVGQLDDEAVFYLRSRGLGEVDARRLLIHAFAGDVINRMSLAPVRTAVEAVLQRQLAHALGAAA